MMDAGRELDALIALQVFRYTLDYEFADTLGAPCVRELRDQYDEWGMLPHYSTDMADAWLVVEKLRADGLHIQMNDTMSAYRARFFTLESTMRWDRQSADGAFYQFADSAPLAICRAALAACGVPS